MIVKKKDLQIAKFLPYFIQAVNFNVFLHAISPFRKKKIKEQNLEYDLFVVGLPNGVLM